MRHFNYAMIALGGLALLASLPTAARAGFYQERDLVSDGVVPADNIDPNLKNPWGISFRDGPAGTGSPFWVADQKTGVATLYNGAGQPQGGPLVVTIPPPSGITGGSPTGTVFNNTTNFQLTPNPNSTAAFLFASLNGTISGWNPNVNPINAVTEQTITGAVFTGLALAFNGTQNQLYAADNKNGKIDVFGPTFAPVTLPGTPFTDPNLPAGSTPYNIQSIGGKLYVTYENGTAGAVDIFNPDGTLFKHISTGTHITQPWGLALAPSTFGPFGGDLLVGNKADGTINAFNPTNGDFIGPLTVLDANGNPITHPGLWGLAFGTGSQGFDPNTLYATAGIGPVGGNIYSDGVFFSVSFVPEPPSAILYGLGMIVLCGVCHWGSRRRQRGSAPVPAGEG